jgi:hypothetical protein
MTLTPPQGGNIEKNWLSCLFLGYYSQEGNRAGAFFSDFSRLLPAVPINFFFTDFKGLFTDKRPCYAY